MMSYVWPIGLVVLSNVLYQIEVNHVKSVTFDAEMVRQLFA